jgi:glycosyltransferase involved in cell wall biosynthesis
MRPAEWLPIPSNIPVVRAFAPPCRTTVTHFGTYGPATVDLVEPTLVRLLDSAENRVGLLLGRGGDTFRERLTDRHPRLTNRLYAPGELPEAAVAARLVGSSLMLQPFIDGISSRRTSAMAGLANGVPVVSNLGPLSEPLWAGLGCVRLAPRPDPTALADAAEAVLALSPADRADMGRQAAALYRERFGIENTLARLRASP